MLLNRNAASTLRVTMLQPAPWKLATIPWMEEYVPATAQAAPNAMMAWHTRLCEQQAKECKQMQHDVNDGSAPRIASAENRLGFFFLSVDVTL